jgi:hypothetical protein
MPLQALARREERVSGRPDRRQPDQDSLERLKMSEEEASTSAPAATSNGAHAAATGGVEKPVVVLVIGTLECGGKSSPCRQRESIV